MYLTARCYGTALLSVKQGFWGRSGQTTDEEMVASFVAPDTSENLPEHPGYEELPYDLFLSSIEAINLWLDPSEVETVDEVQSDSPPIILPPKRLYSISKEGMAFLNIPPADRPLPVWDKERRELKCGNVLMKRYRQKPGNQESLLGAFQEAGWAPKAIDSPMKRNPRRLGYTLESFNKPQQNRDMLIRFSLDGETGVLWNWCDCP